MIKPTVGRIVWYRTGAPTQEAPWAAIVTYVHDDRHINIIGFDPMSHSFPAHYLTLCQENEPRPEGPYAEWMPYQIGQAKKHEDVPAASHIPPLAGGEIPQGFVRIDPNSIPNKDK